MTMTGNAIDNNTLAALSRQAAPRIVNAIKQASHKTGVNFAYLMEQAAAESSFKPEIKAKTSSATGLYQFIEKTWLNMVKKHGDKYGMGDLAAQIDGKGNVADPATKNKILELRKNPEKAALLAAEFAAENKAHLEQYVDGEIGATELYFAHFMGASGATGFLNAMKDNPMATGADLFPKEARANRNVFYDQKTGQPRTLAGIYDFFDKKFAASRTDSTAINPAADNASKTPPRHNSPLNRPQLDYTSPAEHNIMSLIHNPLLRLLDNAQDVAEQNKLSFTSSFSPSLSSSSASALSSSLRIDYSELLVMAQLRATAGR